MSCWLISFEEKSYPYFKDPFYGLIKLITNTIQRLSREKIIRVSFSIFRNLCENDPSSIEVIVDSGLLKSIDNLSKTNIKDEDLKHDMEQIGEILENNIKILSSFEKYVKELNTDKLEWTPVHSEKFWKENVKRFEDQDFYLIRKLVQLINSQNDRTVAVACYDLGEFCRFHPFGKNIVEKMNAKNLIMHKAQSENNEVRETALVAL